MVGVRPMRMRLLCLGWLALLAGVVATRDAQGFPFAYVTHSGNGFVSVVDTATDAEVTVVAVGASPGAIVVSPDGYRVYVLNRASKTISIIDATTNAVSASMTLPGALGVGLAINPNGDRLYVLAEDATISIFDTDT